MQQRYLELACTHLKAFILQQHLFQPQLTGSRNSFQKDLHVSPCHVAFATNSKLLFYAVAADTQATSADCTVVQGRCFWKLLSFLATERRKWLLRVRKACLRDSLRAGFSRHVLNLGIVNVSTGKDTHTHMQTLNPRMNRFDDTVQRL